MSVTSPLPPPRAQPARARRLARLRRWWIEHDDQLPFTLAYLGLALVLSLAIGLFWLVAVVALHAALEYWALGRQRQGARLGRVLWHVKLDIALVLFALCLAVYMDLLFGIAGLAPAARAGMQAGSRFLAWQKGIRGLLLSLDDAALLAGLDDWLKPALAGKTRLDALSEPELVEALKSGLDWRLRQRIDALAPTRIEVPSGQSRAIQYAAGQPPVLAVKLQELFGLADTPRICEGRVPLTLHLLSPAALFQVLLAGLDRTEGPANRHLPRTVLHQRLHAPPHQVVRRQHDHRYRLHDTNLSSE